MGDPVVVIGGGIAGASAAYFLALSGRCDGVVLLEAEAQLAQHTTGRSAALLTENYGSPPVRPLTTASLDFLHSPPDDLVDQPVLSPRGIMTVSTLTDTHDKLERELAEGASGTNPIVEISPREAEDLAPHVHFGPDHRIMWEAHAFDIDVAALHQCYVRGFKDLGGEIRTSNRVDAATRGQGDSHAWRVETTAGSLPASCIVNAAGAWGDVVAERAGVAPIGLRPLKRTAFMVTSPFEDSAEFAFVAEVRHQWYLRPDGRQFMCSPADEAPSEPCDARADEVDIARTIDLLNDHTKLQIRSVNSHWAGLRTFAPDRAMVIGPEPEQPDFVWCVGQGGTGIQTSPAAGRLTADLIVAGEPSTGFAEVGLDLAACLPDRLRIDEPFERQ